MTKVKFFDLKDRKSFTTDKFTVTTTNGRKMAKTTAPSGAKATVFLSKDFKK